MPALTSPQGLSHNSNWKQPCVYFYNLKTMFVFADKGETESIYMDYKHLLTWIMLQV